MGFPGGTSDNTPADADVRNVGSILGSGRSLEKEMATHSSILAWRIPWMEEPGRLQSRGLQSRTRLSYFTHTLVKSCSKFSNPGLSNTWTMNFQMFKMVLEKAKEPEIKLPTSTGSSEKQESSRKTSVSALLTIPKPLTVWITINWKILREMGIPDHLTCLLRNLYAGQEAYS